MKTTTPPPPSYFNFLFKYCQNTFGLFLMLLFYHYVYCSLFALLIVCNGNRGGQSDGNDTIPCLDVQYVMHFQHVHISITRQKCRRISMVSKHKKQLVRDIQGKRGGKAKMRSRSRWKRMIGPLLAMLNSISVPLGIEKSGSSSSQEETPTAERRGKKLEQEEEEEQEELEMRRKKNTFWDKGNEQWVEKAREMAEGLKMDLQREQRRRAGMGRMDDLVGRKGG